MEEVIRYIVEIDTSRAEAKMNRVFAKGGVAGGGPGGQPAAAPSGGQQPPAAAGRAPTTQEIMDGLARAAAGGNTQAANSWMRMNRMFNEQQSDPSEPNEKAVGYSVSLLKKMSSRMTAAGLAAMNFARTPGQFGAMAGVAIGGKAGVGVSAISTFIEGLMNAAEALKNYSAPLFATMTQFGLTMEALKWKMGAAVGEALSRFMEKLGKLAVAIEPIASKLINLIATALDPVIYGLTKFAQMLGVAIAGLEVMLAWINQKTGGEVGNLLWAAQNPGQAGQFIGQNQGWQRGAMKWSDLGSIDAISRWWSGKSGQPESERYDDKTLDAARGTPGPLNAKDPGKWLADAMKGLKDALDRLTGKLDEATYGPFAASFLYSSLGGGFKHGPQVPNIGFRTDAQPTLDGMANPAAAWIDRQRGAVGGGDNVTPAGWPLPQANPVNMQFNEQIEVRASDEDRLLSELLRWRDDLMGRVRSAGDMRWFKLAAARGGYRAGMGVA